MIPRIDTVWLPADEVRCQPSLKCADQIQCARRMATLAQGSPLGDYSHNRTAGDPCQWFKPITRMPIAAPVKREAKPWPVA